MDIINHTFTRGQALVLVGPQASGKTTLARQIATRNGAFVEVELMEFMRRRGIDNTLASEPKTVIIDGLPAIESDFCRLKSLITSETTFIRSPYSGRSRQVKTPNFIFCTGEAAPFFDSSRRFFVIRLEKKQ
ncbi:VapE domain-containing protein [Azonexus caeni]|jgi:MoxR-like ATPase|uniref:VapE domain-containing protein n=1 Tax=Azonexus caeni TaxID=266126 RepID=UPI003A8731E6